MHPTCRKTCKVDMPACMYVGVYNYCKSFCMLEACPTHASASCKCKHRLKQTTSLYCSTFSIELNPINFQNNKQCDSKFQYTELSYKYGRFQTKTKFPTIVNVFYSSNLLSQTVFSYDWLISICVLSEACQIERVWNGKCLRWQIRWIENIKTDLNVFWRMLFFIPRLKPLHPFIITLYI